MTMRADRALDFVHAAYRFGVSAEQWLAGLLNAAEEAVPAGALLALETELETAELRSRAVWHASSDEGQARFLENAHAAAPDWIVRATYGSGRSWISLREAIDPIDPRHFECGEWLAPLRAMGLREMLGIVPLGMEPGRTSCALFALLPEPAEASPRERRLWDQVALHLAAAQRMRQAEGDADAVLRPDGRCVDAKGVAHERSVRAGLRAAVRLRERLLADGERDDEQALSLWHQLATGRWILVDRFESDGRRYVVARPNPAGDAGIHRLTERERAVAEHLARGAMYEEIGFELGIRSSTVAQHTRQILRKLRLPNRVALVRLLRAVGGGGSAEAPPSAASS